MRIGDHLASELGDTLVRLDGQVLDIVPVDRWLERAAAPLDRALTTELVGANR